MLLVNMLEGRFISEYDYEIATRIATVVCGGEVDRGALVDEEWLLKLERKHFVELAQQENPGADWAHAQDGEAVEELRCGIGDSQRRFPSPARASLPPNLSAGLDHSDIGIRFDESQIPNPESRPSEIAK